MYKRKKEVYFLSLYIYELNERLGITLKQIKVRASKASSMLKHVPLLEFLSTHPSGNEGYACSHFNKIRCDRRQYGRNT